MVNASPSTHRPPLAAILIVPVVVAVVLTLFAWPTAKVGPREVPVGVAGAPAIAQGLEAQGGKFDVHRYATETDARTAIEDREVYGAFVAGSAGAKLLIASAGSPAVAQMLMHAASDAGDEVLIEDVVASTPAGGAVATSVLPLVIAGLLTGALAVALGSTALRRGALAIGGALLAGTVATLIIQSWLDVVGGDWLANAGVLTLTVLAIAATAAGLEALLGKAGLALAALTFILIGNPFSAVASGPEMLPEPAGALGQLLPPGAGGNLLRSTGFFDGADAGRHVAVLAVWALAGLSALALAALRGRRVAAAAPAVA